MPHLNKRLITLAFGEISVHHCGDAMIKDKGICSSANEFFLPPINAALQLEILMTAIMGERHCVLITGGAGYIGSHLALLLQKQGYRVVIVDDLSTGNTWAAPESSSLIVTDILDSPALVATMREYQVKTVIHLAAKSCVAESIIKPDDYFETNVKGTQSVVGACAKAGVRQLLFSSTAAVYGNGTHGLVKEDAPLKPISPYGQSKVEAEKVVANSCARYGIRYVTFRFFNVIGAHPEGIVGQYSPDSEHLLQKCLDSARKNSALNIFGYDYDTADGTPERDFIHVQDLASLHLHAMRHLDYGGESLLLNAGYGNCYSALTFIKAFQKLTNTVFPVGYVLRRDGDPASLIADISMLGEKLDWIPEYASIEQMIGSSWAWENSLVRRALK